MDARTRAWALALVALLSVAARYQTPNFIVTAPTSEMAQQVGQSAEKFRREIAQDWLGYVMPQWSKACPITVRIERGAGGVTTFNFARGEVFGWNMTVQGPLDQILDSVLPHEVTHTIFASHFRQPLPRWADEGACTTVESPNERNKQKQMLVEFLRTGRGIAFPHMFRMKEYPRDVLPLYAQGHSLSTFLIGQKGKHAFMEYLAEGLKSEDWTAVTQQHYGYRGLGELQNSWLDWVQKGWPGADYSETSIAMRLASGRVGKGTGKDGIGSREGGLVYRGQSPESASPARANRLAPMRSATAPVGEARSTIGADDSAAPLHPAVPHATTPHATSTDASGTSEPGGQDAASGDSSGWRRPARHIEEFSVPLEGTVRADLLQGSSARLGETRPPDGFSRDGFSQGGGFSGPSRYERTGPVAAAHGFPGQHLPDATPHPAVPYQRMLTVPGAGMPGRSAFPSGFAPAAPTMMMPCIGGS